MTPACFVTLWGLLDAPARAVERNPDQTPYIVSSDDVIVEWVLHDEWAHPELLGAARLT